MKKTSFIWISLLVFLSSFTYQDGIENVINALKTGSSAGLAKYFDNYVDITMPEKSSNYSKSQAELVIRDFFNNNAVKNFEVKHKGDNDGNNGQYCIGTLLTKNGKYRVNVFMKSKHDKMLVQEIRIQAE